MREDTVFGGEVETAVAVEAGEVVGRGGEEVLGQRGVPARVELVKDGWGGKWRTHVSKRALDRIFFREA